MLSPNNKISSVTFTFFDSIGDLASYTLKVSNLNHPFELLFWDEPTTTSIGGVKRSNVRAFDAKLSFQWQDVRNQETTIVNFINALRTQLLVPTVSLRFNVTGELNKLNVLPESAVFNQDYINQIKRTPTTINFTLASLRSSISYD